MSEEIFRVTRLRFFASGRAWDGGARRLGLHTRGSSTKAALSIGGNPGGHTDTRLVCLSIVNPMLDLERKAEGAAGPEKFLYEICRYDKKR